ncbi:hypothetical protein [Candidatus Paracaedibacter symbiosus]|uniref:hypothetical protein n=1 Tax=Candidatus Paracaedibacter symbiosus TaxID=244582 RepID=UPI003B969693
MCNEHGINQFQYYQWKDQFLANASKVLRLRKLARSRHGWNVRTKSLKGLVGELTLELKKARDGHEKAWHLYSC